MSNECSICFEKYDNNMDIIKTECDHSFHRLCIHKWINIPNDKYNTCPICRKNIISTGHYLNIYNQSKKIIWGIDVDYPYWIMEIRNKNRFE